MTVIFEMNDSIIFNVLTFFYVESLRSINHNEKQLIFDKYILKIVLHSLEEAKYSIGVFSPLSFDLKKNTNIPIIDIFSKPYTFPYT